MIGKGGPDNLLRGPENVLWALLGGPVKNQGPVNMVKLACVTEKNLKGH